MTYQPYNEKFVEKTRTTTYHYGRVVPSTISEDEYLWLSYGTHGTFFSIAEASAAAERANENSDNTLKYDVYRQDTETTTFKLEPTETDHTA